MGAVVPVHFAHGNGFPSEAYQELFDYLAPEMQVQYLAMVAHQNYPVTNNWPDLVEELIADIKACHHQPVVGLGHSMGGVLMYMAACREPSLFRQVIMLDSPIPGLLHCWLLKLAKLCKFIHYFMPVERAKSRRLYFANQNEAYEYFRTKPLFKQFTPRSLALYVQYGLVPAEQGLTLRFDRTIESKIYATMPDNLYRYKKPASLTVTLLYSIHSHLVLPELAAMQKYYGIRLQACDHGSHLFPFEYPEFTAKMIKTLILKDSTL